MGYENAPATEMVATYCACCSRPLVDAVSVEAGIGPECRAKHGFELEVSPEVRDAANKLVHQIACEQTGARVSEYIAALAAAGFTKLAARIMKRVGVVVIELEGETYRVRAPYNPEHVEAMRRVPGRRFVRGEGKGNCWDEVPVSSRRALWDALSRVWAGRVGIGGKGAFVIR